MKKTAIHPLICFGFLLAFCEIRAADQTLPSGEKVRSYDFVKIADRNGDGRVDSTESAEWKLKSKEEAHAIRKRSAEARALARKIQLVESQKSMKIAPEILAKFDKNKNGIMEPIEWEAHRISVVEKQTSETSQP